VPAIQRSNRTEALPDSLDSLAMMLPRRHPNPATIKSCRPSPRSRPAVHRLRVQGRLHSMAPKPPEVCRSQTIRPCDLSLASKVPKSATTRSGTRSSFRSHLAIRQGLESSVLPARTSASGCAAAGLTSWRENRAPSRISQTNRRRNESDGESSQ
jgi:hypothetical protein